MRGVCEWCEIAQVIAHSIYSIRQKEIVSMLLIMPHDTSLPAPPPPHSVHANYYSFDVIFGACSNLWYICMRRDNMHRSAIQHLYDSNHSWTHFIQFLAVSWIFHRDFTWRAK